MSNDGNQVIVGDPFQNNGKGAAYIFEQSSIGAGGLRWVECSELEGDSGVTTSEDKNFGIAVAIDEGVALVGFPNWSEARGLVYVFHRSSTNSSWIKSYAIVAPNSTKAAYFGLTVDISANTAIIGEAGRDSWKGAAYVYQIGVNSSTPITQLVADDGMEFDHFSHDVSIYDNVAIVGSVNADHLDKANIGAAYIFRETNGTWGNGTKIVANDGKMGDRFGYSVCTRGNLVIVGASYHDYNSTTVDSGAAYLFQRNNNDEWQQLQKLVAHAGGENDHFGESVGLIGNNAIVGANGYNNYRGAVFFFRRVFNEGRQAWLQEGALIPTNISSLYFGKSMSSSELSFVIGAPGGDGAASIGNIGMVRMSMDIHFNIIFLSCSHSFIVTLSVHPLHFTLFSFYFRHTSTGKNNRLNHIVHMCHP